MAPSGEERMDLETNLGFLLEAQVGGRQARDLLATVVVPPVFGAPAADRVTRAELAFAMNLLLLRDLLARVPSALAYVLDLGLTGERVRFDHGALRTVLAPAGDLPPGEAAFTRILLPLGYRVADTYPLDRLAMTGRAYRHLDLPEDLPQFFLSEFHPERFPAPFQEAVGRVLASSRDPLGPRALERLGRLALDGALPREEALRLLPDLLACFTRRHAAPSLADYRLLRRESAEMAWIATEGNAFNHATDRVYDVEALAQRQRVLGRAMKDAVEVSASGRVLQTAFQADPVERPFLDARGHMVLKTVPGSFFEFITRRPLPGGGLDLGFDTSNAQAIFRMTAHGD